MTTGNTITLAPCREIPFNKLRLTQSNVRTVKDGVSIDELAASIARRGLIQSLYVRPILGEDGAETGFYAVPAGGRRYSALERLIAQNRFTETGPVPCVVGRADDAIPEEEISLVENIERAPLHPLDQFRAFRSLHDQGQTVEDIAAAFLVPSSVVKQRLKLVSVSPVLLEAYAQDAMTLEQLMAFTVSPDQALQEQVWEAVRGCHGDTPYHIKRRLTETTARAADKRALFIGVEAYEAAGGVVLRDLFDTDGGGWFQDAALLDRLVADRLGGLAEAVTREGWKWVTVDVDLPYGHRQGLRVLKGAPGSKADHAAPDRPMGYDPEEVARAGVFITLSLSGEVVVDRGFVRPEDEVAPEDGQEDAPEDAIGGITLADKVAILHVGADGQTRTLDAEALLSGSPERDADPEEEALKPLSDRLLGELTAHRTLALRQAVTEHPSVALTLLLHRLVCDAFGFFPSGGCLEAAVRSVPLDRQADDLKDSAPARALAERHEAWRADMPTGEGALWDWLAGLDEASRLALLAHCVSFGVNAVHEKPSPHGCGISSRGLALRLGQADRLARETGLDMVEAGWRPTAANYLGRVPKARILDAVREGAGENAAQRIDHLKKDDMAREAERLLADSGWLPEPLRSVAPARDPDERPVGEESAEPEGEGVTLPAFLAAE
ncbi:ParB/RepB/Spo0J family partition protein [Rhodospirillum sp. A1_3_36]|uniref:ParB/RepB/Spo0J family partition protein n=1 Tax=Rhodospirillum sp. A1_3_36 TaxID=3391666 RepID=UPI0039A46420